MWRSLGKGNLSNLASAGLTNSEILQSSQRRIHPLLQTSPSEPTRLKALPLFFERGLCDSRQSRLVLSFALMSAFLSAIYSILWSTRSKGAKSNSMPDGIDSLTYARGKCISGFRHFGGLLRVTPVATYSCNLTLAL